MSLLRAIGGTVRTLFVSARIIFYLLVSVTITAHHLRQHLVHRVHQTWMFESETSVVWPATSDCCFDEVLFSLNKQSLVWIEVLLYVVMLTVFHVLSTMIYCTTMMRCMTRMMLDYNESSCLMIILPDWLTLTYCLLLSSSLTLSFIGCSNTAPHTHNAPSSQ